MVAGKPFGPDDPGPQVLVKISKDDVVMAFSVCFDEADIFNEFL